METTRRESAFLRTLFGFYFDPTNVDTKDDTWTPSDAQIDSKGSDGSAKTSPISGFAMVYGKLMSSLEYVHKLVYCYYYNITIIAY